MLSMKNKLILVMLILAASLSSQDGRFQEDQDFIFAQKLENQGLHDLAAEQFALYMENYPNSLRAPEACFRAGLNLEKSGQPQNAIATYRLLLLKYPQSSFIDQGQFHLANILLQNGQAGEAALTFERIRLFSPESDFIPQAQINAALAFLAADKLIRASDAVHVVLEQYPTHPLRHQARLTLAKIRKEQNQPKLALQVLQAFSDSDPDDPLFAEALLLKSSLLKTIGRFNAADSVVVELLSSQYTPVKGKAAIEHAQMLHLSGRFDDSNRLIENILNQDLLPEHRTELYVLQTDNYFALKNHPDALAAIENISLDDPDHSHLSIVYRKAVLLKLNDRLVAAKTAFERLIDTPDSSSIYALIKMHSLFNLADLYVQQQAPREAVRLLRLHSRDRVLTDDMDQVLYYLSNLQVNELQDYDGAIRSLTALTEIAPFSPMVDNAQFHIALCKIKSGQPEQAIGEYKEYLNAYPHGDDYMTALNRIAFLQKFYTPSNQSQNRLLSQLLSSSVTGSIPAEELYSLGKTLAQKEKNYSLALTLFKRSLQRDGNETIPTSELLYYVALCHARLFENAYDQGKMQLGDSHLDTLEQTLNILNKSVSRTGWHERSNLLEFRIQLIRSTTLVDSVDILRQIVTHPKYDDSTPEEIETLFHLYSCAFEKNRQYSLTLSSLDSLPEGRAGTHQLLSFYILKQKGHVDSAYQILSTFIRDYPDHPQNVKAAVKMARYYIDHKEYNKAEGLLQNILQKAFYSNHARIAESLLCKCFYESGETQAAQRCLQKKVMPLHSNLYLYLAKSVPDEDMWLWTKLKVDTEPYPVAMKTLQNYYFLTKSNKAVVLYKMALLAEKNEQLEVAIHHFEELFTFFPNDTLSQVARLKSADLYYDRGNYESARAIYLQQIPHLQDDARRKAFGRRVLCEYKLGNRQKADQLADRFKKQFDSDEFEARFLYERGVYSISMKNFDQAEKDFKTIVKKYDNIPLAGRGRLGLARLYVVLNKTDEAITTLSEITTEYDDPDILADAYLNLGDFYYENRQIQNCIHACNKVLEYDENGPKRRAALHLLINAYDDVRLWDRAIALAREYIRLYPNAVDVTAKRTKVGIFLYSLKEYDRAIAYMKELKHLVNAQTRTEIQYWIAKCYADRGDTEKAKSEFLKVKYACEPHKLPFGATALYEAGELYKKEGNYIKAKDLFSRVVSEMGTNHPIGKSAAQKIKECNEHITS
ncbi:tetratricopeptide repeat protein [candidate division KSB1 bacterium]|nr:tetratricopeptide repeat protein [candidate division KSB1 bacterium]